MKPTFEFSEDVVEVIEDGQGITTLHWLHVKDSSVCEGRLLGCPSSDISLQEVLAFCRPGYVFLWTDSSSLGWTGVKRLRLAHKRVSAGSSSFLPVSGFHYIDAFDALTVGLFDGSVHTIHQVSVEPSWSPPTSQDQPSLQTNLTASVRSVFVQCESSSSKPISDLDDNRMCGYFPYDTLGTMAWLHTYVVAVKGLLMPIPFQCVTNIRFQLHARGEAREHTCRRKTLGPRPTRCDSSPREVTPRCSTVFVFCPCQPSSAL